MHFHQCNQPLTSHLAGYQPPAPGSLVQRATFPVWLITYISDNLTRICLPERNQGLGCRACPVSRWCATVDAAGRHMLVISATSPLKKRVCSALVASPARAARPGQRIPAMEESSQHNSSHIGCYSHQAWKQPVHGKSNAAFSSVCRLARSGPARPRLFAAAECSARGVPAGAAAAQSAGDNTHNSSSVLSQLTSYNSHRAAGVHRKPDVESPQAYLPCMQHLNTSRS